MSSDRKVKIAPAVGVHPERSLNASERKAALTDAAARSIIDAERAKHVSNTARLRALRLEKETQEKASGAGQKPARKRISKAKA